MKLKEDTIPVDKKGRPDLSRYTDSAEYYAEMHARFVASLHGEWPWVGQETSLPHRCRVHATWGLITNGSVAIPFALNMLQSAEPDAREDGAAILAEVGKDTSVSEKLLVALASEADQTAKDSLILALGALRSPLAIPALAAIIRNEATDGDTKWTAIESLGNIVRRRFLKQINPVQAAMEWLDKHDKNAA